MSIARKILMGAAGAGSKSTYVDDVFSTYLYKGTDANQAIENGLKLGNSNTGGSVEFKESSLDKLSFASTSDFTFGTGDFTIECFVNFNAISNDGIFQLSSTAGGITTGAALSMNVVSQDSGKYGVYFKNIQNTTYAPGTCNNAVVNTGQWYHLAMVRQSGLARFFVNGLAQVFGTDCTNDITITDTTNYTWTDLGLGGYYDNTFLLNGKISNFRITKGQALYWSNFTAPTQALTTTSQGATASNVKLLCCNKGTLTGKTVGPTITSSGSPTASGFGPFTGSGGEGGLVWLKERTGTSWHQLYDTARGATYWLSSNSTTAGGSEADKLTAFNNNGFSIGVNDIQNDTGDDYASWSFRKSKGFFDIVTYTGNGTTGQNISHNLGSVPGMIMVKRTDATSNWWVYNRGIGATKSLFLQSPTSASTDSRYWNDTSPTASQFTVGEYPNTSGGSYIAYIFAGGNGTTDKAVEFDGTNDYLTVASSSDLTMGTGDFTVECWLTKDAQTHKGVWHISNSTTGLDTNYGQTIALGYQSGVWQIYAGNSYQNSASYPIVANKWYHAAYVRSGGTARLYINGVEVISMSDTVNYANTYMAIGGYYDTNYLHNGKISNLRVVKGQALYTSNFSVPHDPYTTTSNGAYSGNVKLLCCNGSTTTDSTITPATISSTGSPSVTTNNSIFDDTSANVFGEEGDQNLIKCGSFTTDSNEDANIYLGWEPQWVILKRTDGGSHGWNIVDSMRGFPNAQDVQANVGGGCQVLEPNFDVAEISTTRYGLTPTGFYADQFGANRSYVYMALRRPDGYVGKPAEAGTDAFAMDTGNASSTIPNFDSGFPVGFAFMKTFASSGDWYTGARLLLERYVKTNSSDAAADWGGGFDWDSNVGWLKSSAVSAWQSWMWKRGAGFDVATYKGNGTGGHSISHSLNKTPEMIWVKNRTSSGNTGDWMVGHKDLYGGSSPWNGYLVLNKTQQQYNDNHPFNNYTPTSLDFQLNNWDRVNGNGSNYIAILFASANDADGNPISKVGSYSGPGGVVTITTGFQPRFIMVKKANGAGGWHVFDTTRGMGSGNDPLLYLNTDGAQITVDYVTPSSTGWSTTSGNLSEGDYIYYAHA